MPCSSTTLLLLPQPNVNSSSASSFLSKPPSPETPVTNFSSSHLLPTFLQQSLSLVPQDPEDVEYCSNSMAQSHPVQSELHPLYSYYERWQALKQYSDSKDELIQQLLVGWNQAASELTEHNEDLQKRLQNSQLDLEVATNTRRDLQVQVAAKDRQIDRYIQDLDGLKSRNPYVMVLIDGDGLLFQDQWITQGIEGGKRAAYTLRSAIAEFCEDNGGDVEVMAKAVANINGLSRAMAREGTIQDGDMKDFALGFTQAKASFDFIDVGYGKERADSKIKELTRWNLRNHNCKQVFLGVSHDSGYAPFLDEMLQDESIRKRVTVLEGFQTTRELKATGVNIYSGLTDTLFRRDKIPTATSNGYSNGNSNGHTKRDASSSPSTTDSDVSPRPDTPPVLSKASSWATVTRTATPPPKITTPLAHRLATAPPKAKEQPAKWNPGPRGLDPPVMATNEAMESIKNREKSSKFCNNFYLRGYCNRKGSGCPFMHDAKPTANELAAMQLLTRMNPCTQGQECYVDDCTYGHNCPSVRNEICTYPYCKFSKELHPPNTRFANKFIKDN